MLNGAHRLAASMKLAEPWVQQLVQTEQAMSQVALATKTYKELEAKREEFREEIRLRTTWAVQLFDLGKVTYP